jgi:hypothetical protein
MGNLRQLFVEDGAPQRAHDDMREISRTTSCLDVTFQMSEDGMSPFYAKGDHIQSTAAIVLPIGTAVLVVLNVMRMQSSSYQFLFRCRHYSLSLLSKTKLLLFPDTAKPFSHFLLSNFEK